MLASTLQETIHYQQQDRPCRGVDYAQFLKDSVSQLKLQYGGHIPLIYFCDNARIHLTDSVNKMVTELKIKMLFNSPYAPEVNFIERVIRLVKDNMRQRLR